MFSKCLSIYQISRIIPQKTDKGHKTWMIIVDVYTAYSFKIRTEHANTLSNKRVYKDKRHCVTS